MKSVPRKLTHETAALRALKFAAAGVAVVSALILLLALRFVVFGIRFG